MNKTDNYGLLLFEGADPISRKAFNENTGKVDEALHGHDEALAIRPKMQTGSWVGSTPCAAPEKYSVYSTSYGSTKEVTGSLGIPAGSSRDIVLTLDFEPSVVMISGHMEADVNWSGYLKGVNITTESYYQTYTAFTLSGKEYLNYRQVICKGQPVGSAEVSARFPAIETTYDYYANLSAQSAGWAVSYDGGVPYYSGMFRMDTDAKAPVPCQIPALVEFGTTDDGKYTVTIKGGSSVYGTENYADIEGMTYNWAAFG